MKHSNQDHRITISAAPGLITVTVDGVVVASTENALTLHEANYPPVHYIPRSDLDMARFAVSDHATYCPYKGDATHYSLTTGDRLIENLCWSYEEPYPAMSDIRGHVAFYANKAGVSVGPAT